MTGEPTNPVIRIPKNTPIWAVGLIAVGVAVTTCLVTLYTFVRPEVQGYLTHNYKLADAKQDIQDSTVDSILSLVTENSKQITVLSSALNTAQTQNITLSDRVSANETKLAELKQRLTDCQDLLSKGKK